MIDQRLTLDELGDAFGSDVADAFAVGRLLQESIDQAGMTLPAAATGFDVATEARGGFGGRVMAVLADEPTPAPAGFLLPLRRRGLLAGLGVSVRQAWVALSGSGRPVLGRAAALAYVLAVAIAGLSLTGAATIGTAGALGLLGPAPTSSPEPSPSAPTIATPTLPATPPQPSFIVPPTATPVPSATPEASDDRGGGGAEPSDDHGGNSGPGGGGNSGPGSSGSGSGSGSGSSGSGSGSGSDNSGPGGSDR